MAYSYGLLSVNYGLLWNIVASYFGLLGCPGTVLFKGFSKRKTLSTTSAFDGLPLRSLD